METKKVVEKNRVLFAGLILVAYLLITVAFILARYNVYLQENINSWTPMESIKYNLLQLVWLLGLTLIPFQWIFSRITENKKGKIFSFFVVYLLCYVFVLLFVALGKNHIMRIEDENSVVAILMLSYIFLCVQSTECQIKDWKKFLCAMILSSLNYIVIYQIHHAIAYAVVFLISSVLIWNSCMLISKKKINVPIVLFSTLFLAAFIFIIYLMNRETYFSTAFGFIDEEIYLYLKEYPFTIHNIDKVLNYGWIDYVVQEHPLLMLSAKGSALSVFLFIAGVVLWLYSAFFFAKKVLTPKRRLVLVSFVIIMLVGIVYCILSDAGLVVADLTSTPFLGQTIKSDKVYLAVLLHLIIFYRRKPKRDTSSVSKEETDFEEKATVVMLENLYDEVLPICSVSVIVLLFIGIYISLKTHSGLFFAGLLLCSSLLIGVVAFCFDVIIKKRKRMHGINDDFEISDVCKQFALLKECSVWYDIYHVFWKISAISTILFFVAAIVFSAMDNIEHLSWLLFKILVVYFIVIYGATYLSKNKAKMLEMEFDLKILEKEEKEVIDIDDGKIVNIEAYRKKRKRLGRHKPSEDGEKE